MKMTENPPMRPQRQVLRTNRETTGGLLMSVIRTLSTSRDLADRDRERNELRNGFNECDHKLNELISLHNNDLYQVMNTFSKVLSNLSKSKERLLSTREKLMNCQKLLHCKRDELKKLWLESVENRAQLSLLEKVEYVASLPKLIDDAVAKKLYVHASNSCIDGLQQLTEKSSNSNETNRSAESQGIGELSKIEALSEVRTELLKKKEHLFESAIDDLHKHLYQICSSEVRREFNKSQLTNDEFNQMMLSGDIDASEQSTASINVSNKESEENSSQDSRNTIIELTKCLVILNKIPDSVEHIRDRCERELISIAIKSAQEILNTFGQQTSNGTMLDAKWGSFLEVNSLGIESMNGSYTADFSNFFNYSNSSNTKQNSLTVLSFSSMLGLNYDAYSHLPSSTSNNRSGEITESQKSAMMLKNFFTLLMLEYQKIIGLHKEVVLANLKRLESSLHSQMDSDAFYTIDELWSKVQKLVVDLVACVSADSGRPFMLSSTVTGAGPLGASTVGGNPNLPSDLSSYFAKRRPLAGAMNAVNAMTKNTMTAVAASAAGAAANLNETQQNTAANNANTNQPATQTVATSGLTASASTHNFLSSVVGAQRQNAASIFKFAQSSQAISWNTFLAEQQNQKDQQDNDSEEKAKEELDLGKEDGRIISNNATTASPSMINKLFDTLKLISAPGLDNLVVVYGILIKHANSSMSQNGAGGAEKNVLHEHLLDAADKFFSQVREQVGRVVDSSYKRLDDRSTMRLFPLRSAYFENKLIEEAEKSKMSKDESFQLMQQQQQLNSRLYPPLLASVVMVDITARELEALMSALPDYRENYLECICELFTSLIENWKEAYQKIIGTGGDNNPGHNRDILSVSWIRDLDIIRTFKMLPNWQTLLDKHTRCYDTPLDMSDPANKQLSSTPNSKLNAADARRLFNINSQLSSFEDSPEEIRLRNLRETELLAQNMLDNNREKIKNTQIFGLSDGQFEHLAQLQESFDWMAARCDDLVNRISERSRAQDLEPADANIATLNQLVTDFREMSENCLMLIHLEVRVHCFYHLQELDQNFFNNQAPIMKSDGAAAGGTGQGEKLKGAGTDKAGESRRYDAMHEDRVINPLLDDLKRIHDELEKASLKPYKMLYVFEGLDTLIKTIFISSVSKVSRIKLNGIKRALRAIFNIQKRLISISKSREVGLDYCRKYFETLLTTPNDIIQRIIEHGQEFQISEYNTAITLLHNSKRAEAEALAGGAAVSSASTNLANAELNRHLSHLKELLSKVTVLI